MARYPVNNRGITRTDKNEAYRRFMAARMAGQSQQQAVAHAKDFTKGGPSQEQAEQITEKFPPATLKGVEVHDPRQPQEQSEEVASDDPTPNVQDTAPVEEQSADVEAESAQEQKPEVQEEAEKVEKQKPEGVAYHEIPDSELDDYEIGVLRKVYIEAAVRTPDGRWGKDKLIKAIKFERRQKAQELAQVAAAVKAKNNEQSAG